MSQTETKKFDAEVGKVLQMMIHSLYTNKDIFLRELISNASDACDKLKYLAKSDEKYYGLDADLKITVTSNKELGTITISDTGIGMSKEELIENLGIIARSGTSKFLSSVSENDIKDTSLIGQFGVGFYAAFMVASKVTVLSKKALSEETYMWESDGTSEYTISKYDEEFAVGTKIVLTLKEDSIEYVDHFKLKHIIKIYSDHIAVPIEFVEPNGHAHQVNSSSALWTRNKSEISEDEYKNFYKAVSYSADEPWMTIHNKNEGVVEFSNLLFIPSSRTFDLYHPDRKRRVKLYIKRVFIADENVDLVPHYLRFLRGVIDSEDLPLNVSRETLQHNPVIEKIKQSVTNKVLGEMKKKLNEDFASYKEFWDIFGQVFKEGLCEGGIDKEKILSLCLFKSALSDEEITLDQYIQNAKAKQKQIFFLSGEDAEKLKKSPQIEGFISKGIDVLLFVDPVDDFWVSVADGYKEFEFKSVTRNEVDIESILDETELNTNEPNTTPDKEDNKNEEELAVEYFKSILDDKVKDVKISKKLVSSPVCLVSGAMGMDLRMERFLLEQKQLHKSSKKILEINPKNNIIQKILKIKDDNKELAEKLVLTLFDQACILEGEPVSDLSLFRERLNDIITLAL